MRRRIMLVNDDGFQLHALQLALRRQFGREDVDVESFADPRRAFARARAMPFAVVIADYRMPGVSGVAFLKEMRQMQPGAVRVMLTASADLGTAIAAVNEAEIFRYLIKPWDVDFRPTVAAALARSAALVAARQVQQRRDATCEPPPRPALIDVEASDAGIMHVHAGPDRSVVLQ